VLDLDHTLLHSVSYAIYDTPELKASYGLSNTGRTDDTYSEVPIFDMLNETYLQTHSLFHSSNGQDKDTDEILFNIDNNFNTTLNGTVNGSVNDGEKNKEINEEIYKTYYSDGDKVFLISFPPKPKSVRRLQREKEKELKRQKKEEREKKKEKKREEERLANEKGEEERMERLKREGLWNADEEARRSDVRNRIQAEIEQYKKMKDDKHTQKKTR